MVAQVRPRPSEKNLEGRVQISRRIVANKGIFKNEFHQDEKYYICNSRRRKRKVQKSDKKGTEKVDHSHHRRHQTQVMFSGACGVGPDGMPMKVHFEWICKERTALRKSKYHKKGDVYYENAMMTAEYFERDLNAIGKSIRSEYRKLGSSHANTRVRLQIDSAGGHGTAVGHGNFEKLAKMMLQKYNVELVQQPGNSPSFNIMDLTMWQASQLEVDKMNGDDRCREDKLVEVCKAAWQSTPPVKILQAFEMRRDIANEAIENDGWCETEGKGRGGSKRVHVHADYRRLRARLGLPEA